MAVYIHRQFSLVPLINANMNISMYICTYIHTYRDNTYSYCTYSPHHLLVLQMVCVLNSISHTTHNHNSTHHCGLSTSGNTIPRYDTYVIPSTHPLNAVINFKLTVLLEYLSLQSRITYNKFHGALIFIKIVGDA